MPPKKLRLRSKHLFLTYPKCDVALDSIVDQLHLAFREAGIRMDKYIVCHELHEDGHPHRHVWLRASHAPEHIAAKMFDITRGNVVFHGSYEDQKWSSKCAKYTTKDGDYITNLSAEELKKIIETPDQVCKVSKETIGKMMQDGVSLFDIVTLYPAMMFELKKMRENLAIYKQMGQCAKPLSELNNFWYFGKTGGGKSKMVQERYPDHWRKTKDMFWDGYEYQEVVQLEDVDELWGEALWEIKVWADHYVFNGKIKHLPPIKLRPRMIVVTSNYSIEELYTRVFKRQGCNFDKELIAAVQRRFTEIEITKDAIPDPQEVFPPGYFYDEEKWVEEADRMLAAEEAMQRGIDNMFIDP